MKKYAIYIGILMIGLLLGWFLFGTVTTSESTHDHTGENEMTEQWTCSMHPHIIQSESGSCPICGMDLIPVENNSEGLNADQFKLSENAMALANIETTVVGIGNAADTGMNLSGKIVQNEEANVVQVSYFSGRIERLNVNFEGEQIRKGQLLATIYSPELFAAQQELLTAVSLKESQPSLYNAVRNKLKLWKLSDNQINQIEISGKVKENFPVYATVSGTVSEKLVDQGETVKQGQPLLKIANLNTVWAEFDVYENQISSVKKGNSISISSNTNPSKSIKSKISFVDPVLNSATRTITVRSVLNNTNGSLKPGMFVKGILESKNSSSESKLLTIPKTAVLWTGKRSIVYVKSKDEHVFEMREVTLGPVIGKNYEVLDGLNSSEEIVVNGTFTVDAAAQLQGKKSMMNKEGGKTMTGHEGHLEMNSSSKQDSKRLEVSSQFQGQLKDLVDDYISLKNALVLGENNNAHRISKELLITLADVNMKLLTDVQSRTVWTEIEMQLKGVSLALSKTTKIEKQRVHFMNLSNAMTKAIHRFGIDQKVYQQLCPMANDNKGASWLSYEMEIKNPYFGKVMLNCGNTVSEIN
jgi:Cu(I)/Ag(I) efflux system membrane fusion protein